MYCNKCTVIIVILLVTPLAYYYIVNGTVYQCPDIYTYIQSKLISIVDPLRQALEQARNFNRYFSHLFLDSSFCHSHCISFDYPQIIITKLIV